MPATAIGLRSLRYTVHAGALAIWFSTVEREPYLMDVCDEKSALKSLVLAPLSLYVTACSKQATTSPTTVERERRERRPRV